MYNKQRKVKKLLLKAYAYASCGVLGLGAIFVATLFAVNHKDRLFLIALLTTLAYVAACYGIIKLFYEVWSNSNFLFVIQIGI